ncbi:MAG TPA: hypothetical protein VJL61_12205 [Rhodanobacteraceae bacterium]|nr:hypothetical protein [Rhodanobacteraceae bacterium]
MKTMPIEQVEFLWDTASDADRAAAIEIWWTRADPEPGSDEYVFLQSMSMPSTGHGDPEVAGKELFRRGLLEPGSEPCPNLTESGRAVFFRLEDKINRESGISTEEPTPEGIKRYPPDGYFHTDFFGDPLSEPCTCGAECPAWCEGQCGCDACATRLEVYAAPGSAYGEQ